MDDLFETFFRGLDKPFSLLGERTWPAIDVAEKNDAILVRAARLFMEFAIAA
jgi:hypothetical protein